MPTQEQQGILDSAILAMNAYNVNSGRHINQQFLINNQIGNYSLISNSSGSNGFSAAAYKQGDNVVISYRGTNFNQGIADEANGWNIATGGGIFVTSQVSDAVDFYQHISQNFTSGGLFNNESITVTGHSLGGGLAGYVASIYGAQATIFDPTGFEKAASLDRDAASLGRQDYRDKLYEGSSNIPVLDKTNISVNYTIGEFLTPFRLGMTIQQNALDSHTDGIDPITLHSMALQVALQWADITGPDGWEDGAKYVINSYLVGPVADTLSIENMSGSADGTAGVIMQEVIAYSAISSGVKPFGDTAIWSMFDDSANLGVSLNAENRSSALDAAKDYIGDIAVEYAARLALGKVLASEDGDARSGVLYLPQNQGTLSIDFSEEKWTFGSSGEKASDFKDELLEAATSASVGQPAFEIALWKYADHKGQSADNPFDLVKSVSFSALQSGGSSIDILPNASGLNVLFLQNGTGAEAAGAGSDRMIVGSDSSESIFGGSQSDILLGGDGNDWLKGRDGDDFLYGGLGNDRIEAGSGTDLVNGGAGDDVIELSDGTVSVEFGVGDGKDMVKSNNGDYQLVLDGLNVNDIDIIAGGSDLYDTFMFTDFNFVSIVIKSTGEKITFINDITLGDVLPTGATYQGYVSWADDGSLIEETIANTPLDSIKFADGSTWSSHDIWEYITDYGQHNNVKFDVFDPLNYGYGGTLYLGESTISSIHDPASYISHINQEYFLADPVSAEPGTAVNGSADSDILSDTAGSDTISGGLGNDMIGTGFGDDTVTWNPGDGDDVVGGGGRYFGDDTLLLGTGITPSDLVFTVNEYGTGLKISFANQPGSIELASELTASTGNGAFSIKFNDGTIWSHDDILTAAQAAIAAAHQNVQGTSADNSLEPPQTNFTVSGGMGDDTLAVFGNGSGTIVFAKGDGNDQLESYASPIVRHDTLQLTDILPGEVTLQRNGNALVVNVVATGDSFTALDQFVGDLSAQTLGLDRIIFADNSVWSRSDIANAVGAGNQAPIAAVAVAAAAEGGARITGTLSATDAEGQHVSFSLDTPVDGLSLNADGRWTFDPGSSPPLAQGQQFIITANYTATDSFGATDSSTLTITLTGANDAPVSAPELASLSVEGGNTFNYSVPGGTFTDADSDTLALTATLADGSPLPNWITFSNGQFSGQVPDDQFAFYEIKITASDGAASTSTALYLTITPPVEGPPVDPPAGDIPYPGTTNTVAFDPNAMIGTTANDYIVAPSGPAGGSNGNVLSGLDGNDWMVSESWSSSMDGGVGADVLEVRNSDVTVTGSGGSDYFVFDAGNFVGESWSLDPQYTWATITDFEDGSDKIAILNTASGFGALTLTQAGADVEITMSGAPKIVVAQTLVADLTADDFIVRLGGDAGTPPVGDGVIYPTPTNVVSYDSAQMDGTAANDSIFALSSSNGTSLLGRDGDDLLITESWASFVSGGAGNDVIEIRNDDVSAIGGAGYDYFVFDPAEFVGESWALDPQFEWATITGFTSGEDKLAIGSADFDDLTISQVGDNVEISMAGAPRIILRGTSASDIDASDFIFDADPQQALGYADTSVSAWERAGPEHYLQPEMMTWFA